MLLVAFALQPRISWIWVQFGYSEETKSFFLKPERHRLTAMFTLHWFDFECDKDKTLRTLDFIPKCQLWWCRIVDGGDTTGAVHLFQTMERIQQMDGRNRNIKWKYVSAHKAIICQSKTNKIAIIMESKENISTLMWEWELLPLALSPLAAWPTPHWCRGKRKVTISKWCFHPLKVSTICLR